MQLENVYEYDAFGNILESQEELHNRITYTGQQFDSIATQYYLRARYYNPVIGRFTQEDVYRGDGLNLYAYCGNNPVGYYDPSGYAKNESACGNKDDCMSSGEEKVDTNKVVAGVEGCLKLVNLQNQEKTYMLVRTVNQDMLT